MTRTEARAISSLPIRRFAALLFLACAILSASPLSAQHLPRKPFGDSLSRYHQERRRSYHLEHVILNLTLDERQKTVSGTSTLTLRPLTPNLEMAEIDSSELKIRTITQPNGTKLAWDENDGKLRVHLPQTAANNADLTLIIAFEGKPRKGLYFVGPDPGYPEKPVQIWSQGEVEDSHYWFPTYDYPNDKATSEGYYTVNADFTVVSNGRLIGVEEHPSAHTKTFHWKQDMPHSTYLTSVVVGRFEKYSEQAGDIPADYYVPPGTGRDKALRSFHETPEAIRFFSEKIGIPYPYPKYAQVAVHDFVFGGMENISATTLTDRTLHDDGSEPQINSVDLVTHELAHQWFGDLLTCANWANIWLNEGFATYWADLYREHRFGEQDFRYSLMQERSRYIEEDRQRYRRPMVTSFYTDPLDLFDRTTYEKGGLVLDMLRYVLGDENFFASLSNYAKAHQTGTVTTDDLRKAAEQTSGQELGWFFDEWTTKAGYPELEVAQQWDESSHKLHLIIEQKQLVDDQTPIFRMPVDVEFTTASGRSRRRIEFTQARDEFDFTLESKPLMTRFDPDHRLLATVKFPKSTAELIYQIKNDTSVPGRVWAVQQLADTDTNAEIVVALRQTLASDAFWGVKEAAAKGLGEIKTVAARDALANALHDPDARVRQASMRALGAFRKDNKAAKLAETELSDKNMFVAAEAALSIGRIQPKEAKKVLHEAVNRNSDQDVIRRYSLRAFGELGDKKEWETVAAWLTYGKNPETRMAAVDALLKLGPEQDTRTATKLIALVDDPDFYVKQRAMYALAEGNFQQGRAALLKAAQTAADGRVRHSARSALERLESSPSHDAVPGQSELRIPTIRQQSASAAVVQ